MHDIPIKDVLHDHQDQEVVNEQMQLALDQEKEDQMANKYNNEKFIVARQLHAKWITSRKDAELDPDLCGTLLFAKKNVTWFGNSYR